MWRGVGVSGELVSKRAVSELAGCRVEVRAGPVVLGDLVVGDIIHAAGVGWGAGGDRSRSIEVVLEIGEVFGLEGPLVELVEDGFDVAEGSDRG